MRDEIPDFPKDAYPIEGSHNPIESGGVYDALADKQDVLTFDNTPTANSENPVKSGGVYQVVTGKQDRLTFDEVPTLGSQNMVRSGAIALALNNKNDMATPVDTISSSVDNPVKSSAIYEALQGKQDTLTFDAVPTEGSGNVVSSNGIYEALSHAGGTPDWNQNDSDGVGYINNRTHYIEYTFSEKLINASTIDWNDSSTSTTIDGVSYKLIYTLSSNIKGALRSTGKFRVSFGSKYAIASSTYSSNTYTYRTAVEDLGLYIITTSSTVDVYVNWESPSQLLTIEKVTDETYHKLDNNYLDISTTPTSGSVKPISSGAVYTALQDAASMPDWLQDDSTKKSYIKNRTHYSTYTWFQHTSVNLNATSSGSISQNGKTYYLHYNTNNIQYSFGSNKLYKIIHGSHEWFGGMAVYNTGYKEYEFNAKEIGVYVSIIYERNIYTTRIYTVNSTDANSFALYESIDETVHKLPTKYIDVCDSPQPNDVRPITAKGVYNALQNIPGSSGLNLKEDLENKVTLINETSTDVEYPSALAVWKLFNDLKRRIARLEAELGGGTSAIVEDNILEVFNGEENDNILELDDRSYVDENNILNFINSSSTASVDNNILTDDSISVDNGILNVPNATVDDSMIDLG